MSKTAQMCVIIIELYFPFLKRTPVTFSTTVLIAFVVMKITNVTPFHPHVPKGGGDIYVTSIAEFPASRG